MSDVIMNGVLLPTSQTAIELRRLQAVNADLLAALQAILELENTESNEWDGVERLIPEMCNIALAAIAKAVQS